MGALWILLLVLQQWETFCFNQSLSCTNDYINNISCVWNAAGMLSDATCTLQAVKANQKQSCELKALDGLKGPHRSCSVLFVKKTFSVADKIPLTVTCDNFVMKEEFQPYKHVKLHPPGSPVINTSNVSWSRGKPFSRRVFNYEFQLQFKSEADSWEKARVVRIRDKQSVLLDKHELKKGAQYQVRVRIITTGDLPGQWSNWSPVTSWISEVGVEASQDWSKYLCAGLVVGIVSVVLLVLLWQAHRRQWVYWVKHTTVPDPSKYFDALTTVHGGNFQKWLSPLFTPDSFDMLQRTEEISPVEVSCDKAMALQTCPDCSEQWDTSGHSSFLSNLGYFYSRYPGCYEVNPCSVYFSYKPEKEGSGSGLRIGRVDQPLLTSFSYESLAQLGKRTSPQSHRSDSGFEAGNEELEAEAVGCNKSPIIPCQSQLPPWITHCPQLLLNLLPVLDLDLANQEGGSSQPPSGNLEPSSGGYMTLQDKSF